ncbi:glycosyltransferase family 2 protein [Gimesia sp.]|uniref:glycosyltransferase family 2 protein n=1 Tax=Gimesia sp. TaxID=2024833 RepID=UPI003A957D29
MCSSASKQVPYISVVTPVYGASGNLEELYKRLIDALSKITDSFEIIMVNDSSPDNSWEIIHNLAEKDCRLKGINLSRNFGQHHAITAGLDFAKSDWVVVMDCDLQDQPEELHKLYKKAIEGYDVVVGLRQERQDTYFKKLCSKIFFRTFAYFTNSKVDHRIGNFGIYSQKVIQSITRLKEQNRSFGLFAIWVGFRRIEIPVEHAKRPYGKSSYSFNRMLSLALSSIVAHSNKLLVMFVNLGFLIASISFMVVIWLVFRYLIWGISVIGWTSLIASIYLTTGLIISVIGMLGVYVGKIFDEVKRRPLYIIDSTTFEMGPYDD